MYISMTMDPLTFELIKTHTKDPTSFSSVLVAEMIESCCKLLEDGHGLGQLKLINHAIRELRYAYNIFNKYPEARCVAMFGSARTKETEADYQLAKGFSRAMTDHGWMTITGGAEGIMKAGHEGGEQHTRFGLAIRLPFEESVNTFIAGDPKLINFRYFFTRKLIFLSYAKAIGVFPGGFGTQDELFEFLTLVQTGKTLIIPIVLMESQGGKYWKRWEKFVREDMLETGKINPEDQSFYYKAKGLEDAVAHILKFYHRFHSYRYVKQSLVIRLKEPLTPKKLLHIEDRFGDLAIDGKFEQRGAFLEEEDHKELPRLVFQHTRKKNGKLRQLIDCINT